MSRLRPLLLFVCASSGIAVHAQTPFAGIVENVAGTKIEGIAVTLTTSGGESFRATTDDWGEFEFPSVPSGLHRLNIDAPDGYKRKEHVFQFPLEDQTRVFLNLELIDPPPLMGRVEDPSGAPIPGAAVDLMDESSTVIQAEVDEAGEYRFDALQAGFFEVRVRFPGFVTTRDSFRLSSGDREIHSWTLSPGDDVTPLISGRLVDEAEKPVTDVELKLFREASEVASAKTNNDGRFQFGGFFADVRLTLSISSVVRRDHYLEPLSVPVEFEASGGYQVIGVKVGPSAGEITLKRAEQPAFVLNIAGTSGMPLADALVIGHASRPASNIVEGKSNPEGVLEFPFLAPGAWTFTVRDAERKLSASRFRQLILPPGGWHEDDSGSQALNYPSRRTVQLRETLSEACQEAVLADETDGPPHYCVGPTNELGQTALILAAAAGIAKHMKLLIAWKADPDQEDLLGFTALQYATRGNYSDAVRLLLENGANPNFVSSAGISALQVAEERSPDLLPLFQSFVSTSGSRE